METCGTNEMHVKPKWYNHQPEAVIENDSCKILWDFTVQADQLVTAKGPDLIFIDKKHHECQIIDFAILYDTKVDDKEGEKIEKYLNLARELKKVWNMKATVLPLGVGALGKPAKALEKRLKTIGIEIKITEL